MLGGAAGQDQCLARGDGLVHKERGVDLLFGAGKGEDDFRALVLIEREQVAACLLYTSQNKTEKKESRP